MRKSNIWEGLLFVTVACALFMGLILLCTMAGSFLHKQSPTVNCPQVKVGE